MFVWKKAKLSSYPRTLSFESSANCMH